jgi:LysM repeat protein
VNGVVRERASGTGRRKRRPAPLLPLVFVLSGCFATSKSLEDVQSDITRKNAWASEELSRQQSDIDELRAENEALRQRMDDLSDQLASLGGDVSNRLTALTQSDEQVAEQVREALQSTGVLAQQRRQDREETLDKMNAILEEVLQENRQLRERLDALEKSAFLYGRIHKVKEGESVASIAKHYGVSTQAIVEANDLSDASLIHVGQDLLVPGTGGP